MGAKAGWIILVAWLVTAGAAFGLTGPELASEFDRGLKAYDAKDYRSAFVIWWQIKNQDLAAMRNVGLMLRKGEGVARNPKAAEKVLWTAAATGMANAKVDLAEMYLNGETGPPAPKKALTLLQEASAVGHPLGQFLLAQMYEDGNGVNRDTNRATELYIAAARGGLHEAKLRLAALGTDQPASPLPKAEDAKPKPEPAVPAVAPVPAVPPLPEAAAYVQLGAFQSMEAAQAQWDRLGKMPALVSLAHRIEKADLGHKGVWYRLLAATHDRQSAVLLCGRIRASGQDCLLKPASARQ